MASLTFMLVLSMCLQGHALTLNTADERSDPDAMGVPQDDSSFLVTRRGDLCQDCTQIVGLLADMLSSPDLERKMTDGADSLCNHLPVNIARICKDEVKRMLPLAIAFITGAVKPAEVCRIMGICSSSDKQEMMLRYFVKEALQAAVTQENRRPTSQCALCLFILNTLEELLPKDRTESAVIKLLEEICHVLPSPYLRQCETVIDQFSKAVLDAILSYATPQTVCALIQLCEGQEASVDPCILPKYRCRDIKTAVRCGTVFYCQRFAWRSLDYKAL